MEERVLKKIATYCTVFMMMIVIISLYMDQNNFFIVAASGQPLSEQAYAAEENNLLWVETSHSEITFLQDAIDQLEPLPSEEKKEAKDYGTSYLVISKEYGNHLSLEIQENYLYKELQFTIQGLYAPSYSEDDIQRHYKDQVYYGVPTYESTFVQEKVDNKMQEVEHRDYANDFVHNIYINHSFDGATYLYTASITLEMDHVYEFILHEDENAYYIELKRPREVYDKILVIDAGHGGKDAGSISLDEQHYEKNLNLKLITLLKQMLDEENIKVYYTRLSDDKVFLKPRVNLANDVECDFFVSIHCNSSTSSVPKGTEVLYWNTNVDGISTKELATIFQEEVCKKTTLENRGILSENQDDIFILGHAKVPAVLVEVGYISNLSDLRYILNDENCYHIAQGIYNGILRAYDELK